MSFHFDAFLVLWMHGSFYTAGYSLVAAVPDIYKSIYHFNELQIGLGYLPRGAGIVIGGLLRWESHGPQLNSHGQEDRLDSQQGLWRRFD